jgi:outer membrane receptor protein involved in Fe transport
VENTIVAPYVIDQMKVSAKVDVLLGLRYDDIESEGTVMPLTPVPFPATSFSRDDSELSPMGGVVVSPRTDLSFYANAGRSYAPPSTRLAEEPDVAGREPEQATQYEVGTRKSFRDGRVRTTLAAYHIDRERIAIVADPFGFTQQTGDQRSRGVELEVAAGLGRGLRGFFSYAYNDSELERFTPFDFGTMMIVDYSGNTPILAPEHVANLWVSKSFDGGLGLAGGARWVDEQFVHENNLFAIDSFVVFDAAVFYDVSAWRLKLNLKNVTDEEYETRGIAGSASVIPADPFAVFASVEFRM